MDGQRGVEIPEEFRLILHDNCIQAIQELQEKMSQMMEMYKNNSTFPFDFYNLAMREADTKISCVRELYKRIAGTDLD
ncbi:MAG TPA: hypothetical protein VJ792_08855 [Candidatus Nitrosotalea sp.]|nr:hypothetical protein [Candidatus Nitrosotalea sp.]